MNPQQYYQYQLAASAGGQTMPMYAAHAHYMTANPSLAGLSKYCITLLVVDFV